MINKLFVEHPKSVNETYSEHFIHAMSFSIKLQLAAIVCCIHALVPGFFVKTGSKLISELHRKMVVCRVRADKTKESKHWTGDSIEYMI
ncbi:hypothetical protein EYS14_22885 [Alteromonadaceae bacterium M269]|nr:hypothetical protein EYS14_22885 [Alteromonadaceae bacterium M269]